jgi:hypothetical protein
MKRIITTILALALAAAMFFAGRGCRGGGGAPTVTTRVDTVVVRDTIRESVFVPVTRSIIRVDTVFLEKPTSTPRRDAVSDSARVTVPIERRVYATDNYRAVVEGFRPALVELELYPRSTLVTRETTTLAPRQKRWAIGLQAGYGISTRGAAPYLGVGIQYRFF